MTVVTQLTVAVKLFSYLRHLRSFTSQKNEDLTLSGVLHFLNKFVFLPLAGQAP